jgi:hypothetical protein
MTMDGLEEKPSRWPIVIAWLLVAAGAALRLVQYLSRQAFWADEAPLLQSMQRLDLGGFFYSRLDDSQVAPPLFMAIQKLTGELAGFGELAQRAPVLGMSLLGLVLTLLLARRVLGGVGLVAMVAVVALGDPLIEQAATLKPYSGDVAVTALLLLLAIPAVQHRDLGRYVYLALLGAIAMWLSHASIIVYGAVALVMLIRIWPDWKKLAGFAVLNLLPAASIGAMWWFLLRHQQGDDFLRSFWTDDFPNWGNALGVPWWLARKLVGTTVYAVKDELLAALIVPLILLGIRRLWRDERGRQVAMLCVAVVGVAVIMALAGKYPLAGRQRVNLFLTVPWLVLMGAGLDALAGHVRLRPVAWGVVVVLVAAMLRRDLPAVVTPRSNGDARTVVAYLRTHHRQGEPVYVPWGQAEYRWYWPGGWLIKGEPPEPPARPRFWIAYAGTPGRTAKVVGPTLDAWRARGAVVHEFTTPGGGAVCIDLSPSR